MSRQVLTVGHLVEMLSRLPQDAEVWQLRSKPGRFKRRRLHVHQHEGMDPEVMYFRCTRCERLVCGWCQGANDAHRGMCDPCANAAAFQALKAEPPTKG